MKFFLHIGTEKTGTSTIQSFFNLNRSRMLRNGTVYTSAAGLENNRKLAIVAYHPSRRDDFTRGNNLGTDADLVAFQAAVFDSLDKEIKQMSLQCSQPPVVVFSSEHLQSRLSTDDELVRLKDILRALGATEIKIIVYLRRPAEIANSLYSTALKAGASLVSPPSPSHKYWNRVCNHRRTIERWRSVFGECSIIPRLYEPSKFVNCSLIDDIMHVIGLCPDEYLYPENRNESLSEISALLLQRLNKIIPKVDNGKRNRIRGSIVSLLATHLKGERYCMSADLFNEYDAYFRDSNEWVREQFFPNLKSIFSESVPTRRGALSIKDSDLDDIAELIAVIWTEKQELKLGIGRAARA